MKKFIVINILILSVSFAFAQIDTIKGKVIDCETKEALINVDIIIKVISKDEYIGAFTDIDGNFELYYKKGKDSTVTISFRGYFDEIYAIKNGEKYIEICLKPKVEWLRAPIVVTYNKQYLGGDFIIDEKIIKPAETDIFKGMPKKQKERLKKLENKKTKKINH